MVAKGLIDAASGSLDDAAAALTGAFDGLLATDDRFIALRVGINLVALHSLLGASAKAHELLRKLMAWGAEAGMPSFVLDHDRRIVPILSQAREAGVFDGQTGTPCGSSTTCSRNCARTRGRARKPAATRAREELTERERAIVEFIARGQPTRRSPGSSGSHQKRSRPI